MVRRRKEKNNEVDTIWILRDDWGRKNLWQYSLDSYICVVETDVVKNFGEKIGKFTMGLDTDPGTQAKGGECLSECWPSPLEGAEENVEGWAVGQRLPEEAQQNGMGSETQNLSVKMKEGNAVFTLRGLHFGPVWKGLPR